MSSDDGLLPPTRRPPTGDAQASPLLGGPNARDGARQGVVPLHSPSPVAARHVVYRRARAQPLFSSYHSVGHVYNTRHSVSILGSVSSGRGRGGTQSPSAAHGSHGGQVEVVEIPDFGDPAEPPAEWGLPQEAQPATPGNAGSDDDDGLAALLDADGEYGHTEWCSRGACGVHAWRNVVPCHLPLGTILRLSAGNDRTWLSGCHLSFVNACHLLFPTV